MSTIIFPPGHAWSIVMVRGGLIALLGNYTVYCDKANSLDQDIIEWHWAQKRISIRYWLGSSLAGKIYVTIPKEEPKILEVVKSWIGSEEVKMQLTGVSYTNNGDDKTASTDVIFSQVGGEWTYEMLKGGISTLLGSGPISESGHPRALSIHSEYWVDKNSQCVGVHRTFNAEGKVCKPIRVNVSPDRGDILRVITSWRYRNA